MLNRPHNLFAVLANTLQQGSALYPELAGQAYDRKRQADEDYQNAAYQEWSKGMREKQVQEDADQFNQMMEWRKQEAAREQAEKDRNFLQGQREFQDLMNYRWQTQGGEAKPKQAPDVVGSVHDAFGQANTQYMKDQSEWYRNPVHTRYDESNNAMPNPMTPFPGQKPTLAGEFGKVMPYVSELQRQFPQSFGPNAGDSLMQALGLKGRPASVPGNPTGPMGPFLSQGTQLPIGGQQQADPVDSWGRSQFDDWDSLSPEEKRELYQRMNGQ